MKYTEHDFNVDTHLLCLSDNEYGWTNQVFYIHETNIHETLGFPYYHLTNPDQDVWQGTRGFNVSLPFLNGQTDSKHIFTFRFLTDYETFTYKMTGSIE